MNQFENILACVDLSNEDRIVSSQINDSSQAVIKRAIWIARQRDCKLTFYTVLDLSANAYEHLLEEEEQAHNKNNVEDQAIEVMKDIVEKAKSEGVEAEYKIDFGKVWLEIIQKVLKVHADLVLIGTRKETKFNKMLFGSTGQKLLRKCPCPVLVTKPDLDFSNPKVLVPTDFSEVSQSALNISANFSKVTGAKVYLLHVIESYFDYHMNSIGLNEEKISYYKKQAYIHVEESLKKQLEEVEEQSVLGNIETLIQEGTAEDCVLDTIENMKIDIMVMGTVARSGLKGLLVGNTAEKILPLIPCSLLAVKPEGFITPIEIEE